MKRHGALLCVLCAAASAAIAKPRLDHFCGYAYDLNNGQYRYTEVHDQRFDGTRWLGGAITYIAADGTLLGNKTLKFDANPTIPTYRLELYGGRYIEAIESVSADHVLVMRKELQSEQLERATVAIKPPAAADSGFHALIQASLPALLKGDVPSFQFIVAGALDSFQFRVRRGIDRQFEGKPAVQLIAEADSLLRLVAPNLDLTYDPANGRLLEYRGRSNLPDVRSNEAMDVRIVFASTVPADAPSAATSRCAAPTRREASS